MKQNQRYPLRINIGFLLGQAVGTYRDFEFEQTRLSLPPDLEVQAFEGTARFSRAQQGLLVRGDFKAQIESECVRCLAGFLQPIHIFFEELYAFNESNVDESHLIVPFDGHIDLGPLVREYFLMEIPISALCKPDCKGLCPICGEDLNQRTCEHLNIEEAEQGQPPDRSFQLDDRIEHP